MSKKQISMVTYAMILANVMAGLDSTIINTAIPAIIADLHGIQFMGWIIALMLLGMSVSTPIWSKLGEKIGNKAAFELSLLLFVLGSLFQGLAENMYFFLIARTVMGIGAGGMGSIPYIMAGQIFTNVKKRTKILGYIGASFSVAAIVGPLVGGYLVDSLSWHWVFYINIPIGLIAVLLSVLYYREKVVKKEAKFDILGSFLVVTGLVLILLGIQLLGLVSPLIIAGSIILGLLILVFFFKHEAHDSNPVIPISMFKNKALVGDLLLFTFTWGAFLAINTYLPMWAQGLLGTTALIGGMTLIPNSIADTIGTLVVNPLKARFSDRGLILMAIICMLISSLSMVLIPSDASFWLITLIATFSGFGVGFIFVLLQVKVQVDAGEKDMAPATSLSYLIRILAQTVMAAIYGVIMNMALARGVASNKGITMSMMNKLSDAKSAASLPSSLLPTMRQIFYSGLRGIMLCSAILLIASIWINFHFNKKKNID
ncbi:MFS transporter [Lactobacillus hamsteri]|uniref:MFS family major facilitator transporter n=1 Tax=Lactobacillus hamsteri DSM 5661 = JCM 6256 TaxID=1423754 RepID=A0A0R1YCK7_9LACO|nr:MFS transporter [Lactobacillus hamsteri]KRM40296.1 MFS family major facilitator transporter [Lactobacillus hamsteri DSM 5661 = JCM 6256]